MNDIIVRSYDVDFKVIFGIIVIKLIPLLGGPTGSLEPPKKMFACESNTKLGFWATPFYVYFEPKVKIVNTLRKGVETKIKAPK